MFKKFLENSDTKSTISGKQWVRILRYQPQLHEYCDWSMFSGYD